MASNWRLWVRVVEGRCVAWRGTKSRVVVRVGNLLQSGAPRMAASSPFYGQEFTFEFWEPLEQLLGKIVVLSVQQARRVAPLSKVLGSMQLDLATVWAQQGHQIIHKWAVLWSPSVEGPAGFLLVDLAVLGPGDALRLPVGSTESAHMMENLLAPSWAGIEKRSRARYLIRVYRADGLPMTKSSQRSKAPSTLHDTGAATAAQSSRTATGVESEVKESRVAPDEGSQDKERRVSGEESQDKHSLVVSGEGSQGKESLGAHDELRTEKLLTNLKTDSKRVMRINTRFLGVLKSASTRRLEARRQVWASCKCRPRFSVRVSFAGSSGFTTRKGCDCRQPAWSEQLVFGDMYPPLHQRLRLQLFSGRSPIAACCLQLDRLCQDMPPDNALIFGPRWVSLRTLCGTGPWDSVRPRGRLLVSIAVQCVDHNPFHQNTKSPREFAPSIKEASLWGYVDVVLLLVVWDMFLLDRSKLSRANLGLEMSLGSAGDPSLWQHLDADIAERQIRRSSYAGFKATSHDGAYLHVNVGRRKPMLVVRTGVPDLLRDLRADNALHRLATSLLIEVRAVQRVLHSGDRTAESRLCNSLKRTLAGVQTLSGLKLSSHCARKMGALVLAVKHVLGEESNTQPRSESALAAWCEQARALGKKLCRASDGSDMGVHDVFLWLTRGGRRCALASLQARHVLYSADPKTRGRHAGVLTTLALQRGKEKTWGLLEAMLWLGNRKDAHLALQDFPRGHDANLGGPGAPAFPEFVTYHVENTYECLAHIHHGRFLPGSDRSALTDPFVRVVCGSHSATTQTVPPCLIPRWSRTLHLLPTTICGEPDDIRRRPPSVVVEAWDKNMLSNEFLGRAVIRPRVVLHTHSQPLNTNDVESLSKNKEKETYVTDDETPLRKIATKWKKTIAGSSVDEEGVTSSESLNPMSVLKEGVEKLKSSKAVLTVEEGVEKIKSSKPASALKEGVERLKSSKAASAVEDGVEKIKSSKPASALKEGVERLKSTKAASAVEDGIEKIKSSKPTSALKEGVERLKSSKAASAVEDGVEKFKSSRAASALKEGVEKVKSSKAASIVEERVGKLKEFKVSIAVEEGIEKIKSSKAAAVIEEKAEKFKDSKMASYVKSGALASSKAASTVMGKVAQWRKEENILEDHLNCEDENGPKWMGMWVGSRKTGDVLAAVELIQVIDDMICEPPLQDESDQSDLLLDNADYRLEVLFWGLRGLCTWAWGFYYVTLECGDKILQSCRMDPVKSLNFPEPYSTIDMSLPAASCLLPAVHVKLFRRRFVGLCRKYVAHHLIPSPATFLRPMKWSIREQLDLNTEIPSLTAERSPNVSVDEGTFTEDIPLLIEESPTVIDMSDLPLDDKRPEGASVWSQVKGRVPKFVQRMGDSFAESVATRKERVKMWKKNTTSSKYPMDRSEKEVNPDWWMRYFASLEAHAQAGHGATMKELTSDRVEADLLLQIYRSELEDQPEFEGFQDFLISLPLYRAKFVAKEAGLLTVTDPVSDDEDDETVCDEVDGGWQAPTHVPWARSSKVVAVLKCALQLQRKERKPEKTDRGGELWRRNPPTNVSQRVVVRVYVIRAHALPPRDVKPSSDPYLVLELGRKRIDDSANKHMQNLNPIFGRVFELEAEFPRDHTLVVRVMDWDAFVRDDLIGETRIDLENRMYSRHLGGCGVPQRYTERGHSSWRDGQRPSEILANMCERCGLPAPHYAGPVVTIGSWTSQYAAKQDDDSSPHLVRERAALEALVRWEDMPMHGCRLVPQHVETRSLFHPERAGVEQGQLEMWVDVLLQGLAPLPPAVHLSTLTPTEWELRMLVIQAADVVGTERKLFQTGLSSDVYIKGWLSGLEREAQSTDVHFCSMSGNAVWNWRFLFRFQYLAQEDRVLTPDGKHPPRLHISVMDYDTFSSDEVLGTVSFDLARMPRGVAHAGNCKLVKANEKVPMMNLFLARQARGWWPAFLAVDAKARTKGLGAKVELQFNLVPGVVADRDPVGRARDGPQALAKPQRPEEAISMLRNPIMGFYYLVWRRNRSKFVLLLLLLMLVGFVLVAIYSIPGYLIKRLLGA